MNALEAYRQLKPLYEKAGRKELSLEIIREVQRLQQIVGKGLGQLSAEQKAEFAKLRQEAEKQTAYWMNANISVEPFLIEQGYKENGSTREWRRFSQAGDKNAVLLTKNNTVNYLKTGTSKNLFALIMENYPKLDGKVSNTGKRA